MEPAPKRRVTIQEVARVAGVGVGTASRAPHDVVRPLQFKGSDAIRRNFLRWFAECAGPIGLETSDLHVSVSRNVVFAHMLHLDSGNRNADFSGIWLRSTVCCQRINNQWLITHEHIWLPIDWAKCGMAVVDLTP